MTHDYAKTLKRTEEELDPAGYSPRTVSSYLGAASRFLRFVDRPAEKISREDVRRYFVYLTERGQAPSSINQAHFGVRFLVNGWSQRRLERANLTAPREHQPQRGFMTKPRVSA